MQMGKLPKKDKVNPPTSLYSDAEQKVHGAAPLFSGSRLISSYMDCK